MKKSYGGTIWRMLQEYAIWQPGDHTELGDYGLIKEGCFKRVGNIRDYIQNFNIQTKKNVVERIAIRSDGFVERIADSKDLVEVSFKFKKNYGVILSARDISAYTFLELQKAGKIVASIKEWDKSWFIVTSVRIAGNFVIVISRDTDLTIKGTEKDIEHFMNGQPSDKLLENLSGRISLKMVGENGPLSVRLHQLKSRGDSFKHLEYNDIPTEEWVLVPYLDGISDEQL